MSFINPTIPELFKAVYPKTGAIWSVYIKEVAL